MNAYGLLFMSRTRPVATTAADGTFQLTLLAMDRIEIHHVEPWRVTWAGEEARAFWNTNHNALTPGQPLRVLATHVRTHQQRHCAAEIQAHVSLIELAPRSRECEASTQHQPQAATA